MAHEGVEKILAKARQVATWPNQQQIIQHIVDNCLECQVQKWDYSKLQLPLYGQRQIGPWYAIFLDYIEGLPRTKNGCTLLLVVVDGFSGWVKAFPICNNTAETSARLLYQKVFCHWGHFRFQKIGAISC